MRPGIFSLGLAFLVRAEALPQIQPEDKLLPVEPYVDSNLQSQPWIPGQPVKTTSGLLQGRAAKNRTQVSAYLGIPFAKPPVGDLRWAAPVRFIGDGKMNATAFSSDCAANFQDPTLAIGLEVNENPLQLLVALMQLGNNITEDCLTLNVWTKPQSGAKSKAVLFWIYGGGFATGNSANAIYDGQFLADKEDVVVVSINYRLNIFGFPGLPGDPSLEQNAGLLDQRMALEWVRDNIASFGGDPNRITMFGESAGGASTDFYNYAYTSDPIIASSIVESGSVHSFANPPPRDNAAFWYNASAALGCPTDSPKASVSCMRTKSMDDVLRVTLLKNPLEAVLGHFGPTIDNRIVFSDYKERAAAGKFIQKPLMIGNNNFEAGLFVLLGGAGKLNISENIWPVFNAAVFTCPVSWAAKARASKGILTYRYRYFGDFPNIRLQANSGSWHTSEIPMIFGTTESVTGETNTPSEAKISDFMQHSWASFAKDPASLMQSPLNLPRYNGSDPYGEETLIGFAANNLTAQILVPGNYDVFCESVENIVHTIPGGIQAAISNVVNGREMGIPGLPNRDIPDMSPPPLPTPPK